MARVYGTTANGVLTTLRTNESGELVTAGGGGGGSESIQEEIRDRLPDALGANGGLLVEDSSANEELKKITQELVSKNSTLSEVKTAAEDAAASSAIEGEDAPGAVTLVGGRYDQEERELESGKAGAIALNQHGAVRVAAPLPYIAALRKQGQVFAATTKNITGVSVAKGGEGEDEVEFKFLLSLENQSGSSNLLHFYKLVLSASHTGEPGKTDSNNSVNFFLATTTESPSGISGSGTSLKLNGSGPSGIVKSDLSPVTHDKIASAGVVPVTKQINVVLDLSKDMIEIPESYSILLGCESNGADFVFSASFFWYEEAAAPE